MPCGVGGGTHRSWPGGRGGRPRALIPGQGVRCKGFGSREVGGRGKGFGSGVGGREGLASGQGLAGGGQGLRFRGG